jgi:hypothetical protein
VREVSAVARQPRRNDPRVNLLPVLRTQRLKRGEAANRSVFLVAAVAALSWAVAGVGAALLLGWRPGFGVGP